MEGDRGKREEAGREEKQRREQREGKHCSISSSCQTHPHLCLFVNSFQFGLGFLLLLRHVIPSLPALVPQRLWKKSTQNITPEPTVHTFCSYMYMYIHGSLWLWSVQPNP